MSRPPSYRSIAFAALLFGCQTPATSMMDGMGGEPAGDAGADVLASDGAPPDLDAGPEPPPLTIADLQVRGSFRSYHLFVQPRRPPDDFEHRPIPEQLEAQGLRHFDFDLDWNPAGFTFMVYASLFDVESRCQGSWHICGDPMAAWSRAHPDHVPIITTLQQVDGTMPDLYATLRDLEHHLLSIFGRDLLFTPGDLMAMHPGLTVREILRDHGWPPLETMRGKLLFVLSDELSRDANRTHYRLDPDVERLAWVYADGTVPEDLDADDAAIVLLPELLSDEDEARALELVEAGFVVRTVANDPATYDRARRAGVHLIATRFPDRIFPMGEPPVICNPRTAPPGCAAAAIEPE